MPKSFYIIDGHAQIYRAYFAPFRDLTSASGEPTKASYVFIQMLLNLVEKRRPDYLAMVIDESGEEGLLRKKIYPSYKANRKAPPEDFRPQEERILRMVRDAGVPIFVKPGYEADDVIATMARKLCGQDMEIFLVSKDKDLRQVINDCTWMYDPNGDEVMDAATMEQKLGYKPSEAVEVQTLMGDNIDNVPGIPGIGEKTAVKLIKKYGSADAVLNHLDELTPKMRENFEKNGAMLPITRQLVTLDQNVELIFDPEACRFGGLNQAALRPHFRELGFTNLLKRLGEEEEPARVSRPAPVAPSATGGFSESLFGGHEQAQVAERPVDLPGVLTGADCQYHLVATAEEFAAFLLNLGTQKRFAFDTETDALGAMNSNLVGMSFSWEKGVGYYVPVRGPAGTEHLMGDVVLPAVKPILEDPAIKKVGHNIKYDMLVMRNAGIELRGIELDSMVAAFLIDAGRVQYGIDRLALDLLNFRKVPTVDLLGKGKTQIRMDQVPLATITAYAAEDADIALRLADLFRERLEKLPSLAKLNGELEVPLLDVLGEMEFNGIAVDPAMLAEQGRLMGLRIEALREKIIQTAGCDFNPDSPKQLADVLFNKLKLPTGKKTKTGYSTDVQVLEKLSAVHPCAGLMLEYRTLTKLKNTYLDNLPEYINPRTRRIHPSFSPIGAETGRLSCSDPNLQNIPIRSEEGRQIRLAFVPGDGEKNVLLTADYSQIELRFLAHFTQEPALLRAFEADEDIHRAVAAEVFNTPLAEVTREQRGHAKTINFGIIYGVSAYGLSSRIEGLSMSGAQELITAYNKRFPGIQEFLKLCVKQAQDQGYVETIMGRRRPIPDINSAVIAQRNYAERAAINSVVQGSAADLIKLAMVNVHRRMKAEKFAGRMLLQVHDELVFETPAEKVEAEAGAIREEMVNAMKLRVPLKVEVGWGRNWEEGK